MAQVSQTPESPQDATEETGVDVANGYSKQNRTLGILAYWGMVAFLLAYSGVIMGGFYFQFGEGEYPCPLCMVQRYGMMLATMGAMWVLVEARRGKLNPARYSQGLGMAIIGSIVGGAASTRQVLLHIQPGDSGYGEPILGIHLYTWALITFAVVILYVGLASVLAPRAIPVVPKKHGIGWKITTIVMWLFMAIVIANLIMIIFLEGFAWVLPDDPTSYNLLTQLTGG
ncbi:MAG: disulfide bond formation protein B [Actinomycetia bacterium]|nr:disulfide bond formation protein B [Actinomycetes bacterium]